MGQRALELVRGRDLAGQVALELLVVAGDDLLDQLVVQPVLLVGDIGRQGLAVVAPVGVVLETLVGEDVGDAVQLLLLAEGQFQRHETGPEPGLQFAEDAMEVSPLLVLLVDEHQAGDAGCSALLPRRLRADLDPVDGADHEHGEVGDGQGGVDVAGEVGVAGGVDEIDLVRLSVTGLPLERGQRQRQRHRALDLLGFGVTDRRAVLDPPGPRQHTGSEEDRFDERRLAGCHRGRRRPRCGSCRSPDCSIGPPRLVAC